MEIEHLYRINAFSTIAGAGIVTAENIEPSIAFSAPPEFGGQAGHWTPEHLFVAGVAACYVTTFSAVAAASKLDFLSLNLRAGVFLGKEENRWSVKQIILRPRLEIAQETDRERASRLLRKAEEACLIARSLNCRLTLEPEIAVTEKMPKPTRADESIAVLS